MTTGQGTRILIVGAGSIGLKHLRAFLSIDPPPRMFVVDPVPGARERAAAMGAEVLDTSWESLELRLFDGVVICAPAPMHVPYTARCLREGVPVLSEKPLSHALEGVDELVELSMQPNAPVSGVAYVRRYIPMHEMVAARVRAGECGHMPVMRISCGQPFTTYRPDYRSIYYASREQGGGCTLDFASHFIDLAQWYLGRIESIQGYIAHSVLEGVEVEDNVALNLRFESGALGTLAVNQFQPVNENLIDLCGPNCCLRIVEPAFTLQSFVSGSDAWKPLEVPPGDYLDGLRLQAAAFLDAIGGGPPLRTSTAEAAHTLRLCLQVLESAGQT